MTHTDVSEESQLILDTFSNQSLLDSVISCIGNIHHKDNLSKSQSIIDYLQSECEKLQPGYYLEESTSAEKIDPMVRVTQQLMDGWKTGGGLILPLTEPPAWGDYSDYSRNVRYKIHSWVMLDSLLLADSLTDENAYLDYAISIADDWIDNFVYPIALLPCTNTIYV